MQMHTTFLLERIEKTQILVFNQAFYSWEIGSSEWSSYLLYGYLLMYG
jgi:hypothetical protein